MVALDNKIEQAMVSSITASLLSSDLAAAYVTLNRSKGMDASV